MKHLLAVFLFCCVTVFSFGQGRTSLGADVAFPTGSGTDGISTGFGAWIRHEKGINKNFTWMVSAGYLYFPGSSSMVVPTIPPTTIDLKGHFNFLPLLLGAKYYPKGNFNGVYFGVDLGVTQVSFKGTLTYSGFSQTISESDNKFTAVPMIGFHGKSIDLGLRYSIIDTANFFGIRLGVALN